MISSYLFVLISLIIPLLPIHLFLNAVDKASATPNVYPHRLTTQQFSLDQRSSSSGSKVKYRIGPPLLRQKEDEKIQDELMDIVLLATVDGKFHALNRTNGVLLWSMHDEKPNYLTDPSLHPSNLLKPLVQTENPPPETAKEDDEEFHIVEPQSGAIYVLPPSSSPNTPISKLPYTVPQLVEMGAFKFPEDESRVFVGSKRTSLLVLDLDTGQIRGVVDTETECAWDMFAPSTNGTESEVDLDELDGSKSPRTKPKEVYIGRTIYHLQIHTLPTPNNSLTKRKTQKLQFTSYHPNSFHTLAQANYKDSADGAYVQGLTGGEVLAFVVNEKAGADVKTEMKASFKWGTYLTENIAVTFDIFNEDNPYALLQPAPSISKVFAGNPQSESSDLKLGGEAGYVGLVGESLYVLGSEAYPLIIFSEERRPALKDLKLIEGGEKVPLADGESPPQFDDSCKSLKCLVGLKERIDGTWGDAKVGIGRLRIDPPSPTSFVPDVPETGTPNNKQMYENTTQVPRPEPTGRTDVGSSLGGQWIKIAATIVTAMFVGMGGVLWSRSQSGIGVGQVTLKADPPAINGHVNTTTRRVRFADDEIEKVDVKQDADAPVSMDLSTDLSSGTSSHTSELTPAIPSTDIAEPPTPVPVKVAEPIYVPPPETPTVGTTSSGIPEVVILPATPVTPLIHQSNSSEGDQNSTSISASESSTSTGISASTTTSMTSVESERVENEVEDDDAEAQVVDVPDTPSTPGTEDKKKKNRMRSKTKKKKAAKEKEAGSDAKEKTVEVKLGVRDIESAMAAIEKVQIEVEAEKKVVPVKRESSLSVTEEVLGFGSHGTMVFKGSFQGRAVAVKRLLNDFVTLASREVTLLQESDEHPNVIRYYFQEARDNFLYIALELCPASLADVIERPDNPKFTEISCSFDPKRALMQITSGLRWLHGLKIIHRDIKPQNILVAHSKSNLRLGSASRSTKGSQFRMLISDFGLCKKLGADETSFVPTVSGAMAAGTVGWRAPEILRGEVKVDETSIPSDDGSQSSRGSVVNGNQPNGSNSRTRLTKSVDVFALGCLFYYTLTSGSHPYGDRYERDINIMKDRKDLSGLQSFGEEGAEAVDLITKMLSPESSHRPDTTTVLLHPFFWTPARRLTFLQDASDRFEIMNRDPREAPLVMLETGAQHVVGNDWHSRLDRTFIDNLGKFRKYDGKSVQDLMRALRNKKHHYQDLPEHVKRNLGPLPEGFLMYFTHRYPALFLHVYYVVANCGLAQESMFQSYFELVDI